MTVDLITVYHLYLNRECDDNKKACKMYEISI